MYEKVKHPSSVDSPSGAVRRLFAIAAASCLGCVLAVALIGAAGCDPNKNAESTETTETVGAGMAGPVVDVQVTQEALDSKPDPWVLTTPEDAVRSYLAWTSYAYRIGQSQVAVPTMSAYEEVRVDSYVQYNLQKYRLIDQTLDSISFGTPKIEAARAVLPAKETWTYRYVSIQNAGETLEGPYSASYETTYTVIKNDNGEWVVDKVDATALGTVK